MDNVGNEEAPPDGYDVSTLNVSVSESTGYKPLELEIFPNPANSYVNIIFNIQDASYANIKIFNSMGEGQSVQTENTAYSAGTYSLKFDTQNLPAGIYVVLMRYNDKVVNKRFVVVR